MRGAGDRRGGGAVGAASIRRVLKLQATEDGCQGFGTVGSVLVIAPD